MRPCVSTRNRHQNLVGWEALRRSRWFCLIIPLASLDRWMELDGNGLLGSKTLFGFWVVKTSIDFQGFTDPAIISSPHRLNLAYGVGRMTHLENGFPKRDNELLPNVYAWQRGNRIITWIEMSAKWWWTSGWVLDFQTNPNEFRVTLCTPISMLVDPLLHVLISNKGRSRVQPRNWVGQQSNVRSQIRSSW